MNKIDKINYLNGIIKYLNLSAVCSLYNTQYQNNKIDYNNLRVVLKKQSISRLSEEKLDSFIYFLHNSLIPNTFQCNLYKEETNKKILIQKINKTVKEFETKILKEINNEI